MFAAATGEIVGPIRVNDRYVIARVLGRTPAQLDDATRSTISQQIFEDWLAERRQAATIMWYWGTAREESTTL